MPGTKRIEFRLNFPPGNSASDKHIRAGNKVVPGQPLFRVFRPERCIGCENIKDELRIRADVLHDRRDLHFFPPNRQDFSKRILVAKVLVGGVFGEDDGIRDGQRRPRISFNKRKREDGEHGRVRIVETLFPEKDASAFDDGMISAEPNSRLDLRKFTFHRGSERLRCPGCPVYLPSKRQFRSDSVDPLRVCMIPVIPQLILDVQTDQQTAPESDAESGHVDQRKCPVAA